MLSKKLPFIHCVLLLILLVAGSLSLNQYFQCNSIFFAFSIIALVTTWQPVTVRSVSWRCAILAAGCWSLYLFITVYTFCYFALFFTAAFIIESTYRRISILTFLVAVLIAPVLDYFANIFTFPIRLWFGAIVGKGLSFINSEITTAGNVIMIGKNEFSVDTACMGLQMMMTSLLCTAILIAIFQKKLNKRLPLFHILSAMSVAAILNITSNIFRMAVLVLLAIPPVAPAHDIIGIITLIVYVLIPAVYGIRWAVARFGKSFEAPVEINTFKIFPVVVSCLLIVIGITSLYLTSSKDRFNITDNIASLPGTTITTLNEHIIKQSSKDMLLYIKPIPSFYFSDHQPMICWKGSGFEFNRVEEVEMNGRKIFQAVLKKPDATLYTAWWYESKDKYSNSQISWRWDALRNGTHYCLMNVTVSKPEMLTAAVITVMNAHLIR